MSASWRLNQYSCHLCGKSQRQNPLIVGFEIGTFGTRGRSSSSAPLPSQTFTKMSDGKGLIYFKVTGALQGLDQNSKITQIPTCNSLTHLQQITFENIVAKG